MLGCGSADIEAPFSNQGEGRPEKRVRGTARGKQIELGTPKRHGNMSFCVRRVAFENSRHEAGGGDSVHLPVRNEHRSGPGLKERPCETGERFASEFTATAPAGVASRQHDQIGVEF